MIPVFGSDHVQIRRIETTKTKAGGNAGFFVGGFYWIVMAGLDPAIHLLRKTFAKTDGYAGQARV
jgi:hypothetical protein